MTLLNTTHDVSRRSWVASAQGSDFPIQNLPFAVAHTATDATNRVLVAIGEMALDMSKAARLLAISEALKQACEASNLNPLMRLKSSDWSALRVALSDALTVASPLETQLQSCLIPQTSLQFVVPAHIGDYTDFFTSIHHATNVGKLFRPDAPLMPNYPYVPIGYHGRSSSVVVSGTPVKRPMGQTCPAGQTVPTFTASARLDYEFELGLWIGGGAPCNTLGERIDISQAEQFLFGVSLLNDWSARDIQAWEYQPLGPFLAKSFATSISPWVVTLEALAPFRTSWTRAANEPQALPYLSHPSLAETGAIAIQLSANLSSKQTRTAGQSALTICQGSYDRAAYWSPFQLITHHSSNGCNLSAGDLFGSGTLSGPVPEEVGSLLEATRGGKQALTLASGEERRFLLDGDEVVMTAWCESAQAVRLGFGECRGEIYPVA